jgi:hypothetical protein
MRLGLVLPVAAFVNDQPLPDPGVTAMLECLRDVVAADRVEAAGARSASSRGTRAPLTTRPSGRAPRA